MTLFLIFLATVIIYGTVISLALFYGCLDKIPGAYRDPKSKKLMKKMSFLDIDKKN